MNYGRYLVNRVFFSLLVLISFSMIIFVLSRVIPGDPVSLSFGPQVAGSAEQIQALRHRLHLDDPLYLQYYYYVSGLVQGDFGGSLYTQRKVVRDITDFFPATFELMLYATLFIVVLGIPLGVLSARYKDTWVDNLVRLLTFSGVVTPSFVWAIVLQLIFSYWLSLLPVMGRLSLDTPSPSPITGLVTLDSLITGRLDLFLEAFLHLLLPAFSLSLAGMAQAARLTRANMIEISRKEYISAARSYGIPEALIVLKYMLKPSMVPTVTVLGLDFAAMLGNAFLVESIYNWPGLARYGVQAIFHKDLNAIIGVVMIVGLVFVVVNLIIDVIVGYLDPRIRLQAKEST